MAYARLLARHDELFKQLLADYPAAEMLQDTGDGYFAAFATVSDAVRFALRFQEAMHREPWGAGAAAARGSASTSARWRSCPRRPTPGEGRRAWRRTSRRG